MPKKGVLFDLDGTLVESWKTNILPGVQGVITALKAANIKIGVCTNQAGPLWRLVTGDEKYPTSEKIAANLIGIAQALDLTDASWFISVSDDRARSIANYEASILQVRLDLQKALKPAIPRVFVSSDANWRKPKPYMLWFACDEMQIDMWNTLYVGDMASDENAAQLAGIDFVWARDIATLPQVVKGDKRDD